MWPKILRTYSRSSTPWAASIYGRHGVDRCGTYLRRVGLWRWPLLHVGPALPRQCSPIYVAGISLPACTPLASACTTALLWAVMRITAFVPLWAYRRVCIFIKCPPADTFTLPHGSHRSGKFWKSQEKKFLKKSGKKSGKNKNYWKNENFAI